MQYKLDLIDMFQSLKGKVQPSESPQAVSKPARTFQSLKGKVQPYMIDKFDLPTLFQSLKGKVQHPHYHHLDCKGL